ncbi:hypothetical protein GQ457_10G009320 [Hibiscus cannabinus]
MRRSFLSIGKGVLHWVGIRALGKDSRTKPSFVMHHIGFVYATYELYPKLLVLIVGTSYVKARRNGIIKFLSPPEIHVQIPKTGGRDKRLTVSSLINSKNSLDAPYELTNSRSS